MLAPKQLSVLRDALYVKRVLGKGLVRQAVEILRNKRRNPTLGASDYFTYRLYDSEFLGATLPEDFLGWRCQGKLSHALNLRPLVMPGWDKFTFALIANAFGLPVPRLRAFYMPSPLETAGIADMSLGSPEALAHWLRTQSHWPIFAKPSYSQMGHGCHRFIGYRANDDTLVKRSGEAMKVDSFVTDVVQGQRSPYYLPEMGYLFQEALAPHRAIADLLGNEIISGVRVILIRDDSGVEFLGTSWKIATGSNDVDNTRGYETGNLKADVDTGSGRLGKVLDGFWPNCNVVTRSPDTNLEFDGFVMPCWPEVLALAMRASAVFPLMRIQFWDIAITDDGPRILELNDEGGVPNVQVWGRGFLTKRMRALLRDHAYGNAFSWLGPPSG